MSNLFVEPSVSSTTGLNKVIAKKYNKNEFYNQEKPPVWHYLDTTTKLKRWFPVSVAENMIKNQKDRNSAYEVLKQNFDPVRLEYNNAIASTVEGNALTPLFEPVKKTSYPPRPNIPTLPPAYKGIYQSPSNVAPTTTTQF